MFEHAFKRVEKGDRPSSSEYNRLVGTVEGLMKRDGISGNFFGSKYDLGPNEHHIVRGVLLEDLYSSPNPLSAPTTASMLALKPTGPIFIGEPANLGSAAYRIRFVNRSVDTARSPGTFMKIEWTGDEWSIHWIDCNISQEGLQIAIEYLDLIGGSMGSGSLGDGAFGGG